nr:hypothetical protein [Tanacetum cinerariifolium]
KERIAKVEWGVFWGVTYSWTLVLMEKKVNSSWTVHAEDDTKDYALMAFNSSNSGSHTEFEKGGSTEELVSTARSEDSTVRADVGNADPIAPPLTITSIFNDEDITMAQTLIKIKEEKAKEKGDKGKGVLEEPEPAKKMTRSDLDAAQIAKDAKVARLEEKEEYTIEKRAKFLAKTIVAQRRFRAAQRSAEIRKIQGLYERQKRMIDDFKPMDSDDAVDKEKVLEEPDNTKVKVKQEGDKESIRKRPGRRHKMKATKKYKRQKTDSDLKEEEHLKTFLHGAERIYYRIFRSDGSSRWIKTFSEMETRTMFEETTDDDLWKNQEEWILKSWNFYKNYGVHTLKCKDGTKMYMLAERRYPLIKETLERMLALRLIVESKSEAVFDLLRFIQKQIDESGSHDGSEKDL